MSYYARGNADWQPWEQWTPQPSSSTSTWHGTWSSKAQNTNDKEEWWWSPNGNNGSEGWGYGQSQSWYSAGKKSRANEASAATSLQNGAHSTGAVSQGGHVTKETTQA